MNINILKRISFMLVMCLMQALVLNHIHIFGCATPLLYVYLVLLFPRDMAKWAVLVWAFVMGVIIDIFSNTPGVASASLTAIAVIQPYFFSLFIQHDAPEDVKPSLRYLGFGKFAFYVFVLVLVYCLLFFTLETFHFFNLIYWVECIIGSTLITTVLILTLESIKVR